MKYLTTPIPTLLTSFLLILFAPASAQLYWTTEDIREKYGPEDERYEHEDGTFTLAYSEEAETEASGVHERVRGFTFKEFESEVRCISWKLVEPSSEINSNVKMLNKSYVNIGKLKWKDYEHNVIYAIELKDNGFCVLHIFRDDSE